MNKKNEEETGGEVSKLQERINSLEKEIEIQKEKALEAEHSKTDMENKLIQERLRHHQTVGDMQKSNEMLKQAEDNLNSEMEAHRKVIDKSESLKKKIAEYERKTIAHKKLIKQLSQQILDLHTRLGHENGGPQAEKREDKMEIKEKEESKSFCYFLCS